MRWKKYLAIFGSIDLIFLLLGIIFMAICAKDISKFGKIYFYIGGFACIAATDFIYKIANVFFSYDSGRAIQRIILKVIGILVGVGLLILIVRCGTALYKGIDQKPFHFLYYKGHVPDISLLAMLGFVVINPIAQLFFTRRIEEEEDVWKFSLVELGVLIVSAATLFILVLIVIGISLVIVSAIVQAFDGVESSPKKPYGKVIEDDFWGTEHDVEDYEGDLDDPKRIKMDGKWYKHIGGDKYEEDD